MTNEPDDVLCHFDPPPPAPGPVAALPVRASLHEVLDRAIDLAQSVAALARPAAQSAAALARPATRSGLRSPVVQLARARLSAVSWGRSGGPAVLPLGPASPDSDVTGTLEVTNDALATRTDMGLVCSGLVTDSMYRIDGTSVTFRPAAFTLAPGETDTVEVTVAVPRSARPGLYTGVISVVGRPSVRNVLTLEVR
jgi:hypothetical protein